MKSEVRHVLLTIVAAVLIGATIVIGAMLRTSDDHRVGAVPSVSGDHRVGATPSASGDHRVGATPSASGEHRVFAVPSAPRAYLALGKKQAAVFRKAGNKASENAKKYSPTGPFLDWGHHPNYVSGKGLSLDKNGFALKKYSDGRYHYTPVLMAQQALMAYSRDGGPTPMFLKAAAKLLTMQDARGAFPYDFSFRKYAHEENYAPGWVSGMAQGQAMSVFARAYHRTKHARYLAAGKAAFAFMMVPREDGGPFNTLADLDPTLSSHSFVMEYPSTPDVYTLNGFMFAIQGLYDWASVTGSQDAKLQFDKMIETLVLILPRYDIGNFSAYDLSYITMPKTKAGKRRMPHLMARYHAIHIEQLWALHAVTGIPVLKETADRWLGYVTQ